MDLYLGNGFSFLLSQI
uniref:Uncharacterized protein n=1 Tax=Rhizophora mucronata TaxID=61149 RepID=A0A2P2Q2B0_RHIMU